MSDLGVNVIRGTAQNFTLPATPPNPSGMKRLPDESGQPVPVEDPASMKPVN